MEGIWEILFFERLPYANRQLEDQVNWHYYTPDDSKQKKEIECSWKNAYFNALFYALHQSDGYSSVNHLLYLVYSLSMGDNNDEFRMLFSRIVRQ